MEFVFQSLLNRQLNEPTSIKKLLQIKLNLIFVALLILTTVEFNDIVFCCSHSLELLAIFTAILAAFNKNLKIIYIRVLAILHQCKIKLTIMYRALVSN